ncbi:MAG: YihA family ribosome biogenesis GTP-binding protein [Flavobacteriales bacterium]|nr:YihA family ribosome biogenesis GTP-binding protein [Flavobacteriales bacterium]|tara:strand:- start:2017 stop:2628 length:612 start_codon:yes stop_codon:yes gene_type:complete
MKIHNAEFVVSNTNYKNCPENTIPEYSFIGRSNVGKSSLINALVKKQKLAKVSGKPGKTQLINHFIINNQWYLVDLPGYGYAKTSKKNRTQFEIMIKEYLENRIQLICIFLLIDIRHSLQKNDQDFMKYLGINKIPFVIVFTKSDKISKEKALINISEYKNELYKTWSKLPKIFITSAEKKQGLNEIYKFIDSCNKNFKPTSF